jgi:hypothetical protein
MGIRRLGGIDGPTGAGRRAFHAVVMDEPHWLAAAMKEGMNRIVEKYTPPPSFLRASA